MAPLKENNKPKVIRSKLLVATTLLIATIWVAANFLDLSGVVAALASLPAQTAVVVFSLGATSWVLRGLRTWMLFEQLSLREALGMSFIHNTANNLAPMRLGELALPVLARWLGNVEFSVGLTSLLWVRFLDLISLIGISICIVFLPTAGAIMLALLAAFVFLVPLLIAIVIPKTQQIRLPQILEQARDQLIYEAQAGTRLRPLMATHDSRLAIKNFGDVCTARYPFGYPCGRCDHNHFGRRIILHPTYPWARWGG